MSSFTSRLPFPANRWRCSGKWSASAPLLTKIRGTRLWLIASKRALSKTKMLAKLSACMLRTSCLNSTTSCDSKVLSNLKRVANNKQFENKVWFSRITSSQFKLQFPSRLPSLSISIRLFNHWFPRPHSSLKQTTNGSREEMWQLQSNIWLSRGRP